MSSFSPKKQNSVASNNRFVIKLCIVGAEVSPQIRRVKLSRITENGEISYPALVDIAIRYTFPDTSDLVSENYNVLLTYLDVDNDCITIASTEELIDAIEQLNEPGSDSLCLRITTEVKPKNESSSPRKKPANIFTTEGPRDLEEDDSQRGHIVESFVSILTDAVDKLQTRVAESITSKESGNLKASQSPGKEHVRKRIDESQQQEEKEKRILELRAMRAKKFHENKTKEDEARVRTKKTARRLQPSKQELDTMACSTQSSAKESREEGKQARSNHRRKETRKVVDENRQQSGTEKHPFVHPRHTCDGCLVTPIVGRRFHSTNLPDYDLCEKCRNNYKGDQIKFEVVELECDRSVQERHRRRLKREERGVFCQNINRRGRHIWKNRQENTDPDLTEAIRRSLQDVPSVTQDGSLKKRKKVSKTGVEVSVNIGETAKVDIVTEDNKVREESNKMPISTVENDSQKVVESNQSVSSPNEENHLFNENTTTPLCKNAALPSDKKCSEQSNVPEKSASDYIVAPEKSDDHIADLKKSEYSLVANKSDDDLQEEDPLSSEESNPREDMDQTLDKMNSETNLVPVVSPLEIGSEIGSDARVEAQPCSDFSEEEKIISPDMATSPSTTTRDADNQNEHESDKKVTAEVDETTEHLDKGKNDSESTSTDSQDSWQVIPEKEKIGVATEEQAETDEMIARGVQMLGSALFESDLLNSENVSSMTNSEVLSVPSSVPTTLLLTEECEISPTVIEKWDDHLFQLHELGFQDDKKSIEILERLAAANIGVDSNDEVSVTQVVNELLKK